MSSISSFADWERRNRTLEQEEVSQEVQRLREIGIMGKRDSSNDLSSEEEDEGDEGEEGGGEYGVREVFEHNSWGDEAESVRESDGDNGSSDVEEPVLTLPRLLERVGRVRIDGRSEIPGSTASTPVPLLEEEMVSSQP
jgi:hypothetical protein